jgi:hypothetical protein
LATAALTPEQEKTEYGNVVIKPNGGIAPGTGRRGIYNRFGIRQSVNAYI